MLYAICSHFVRALTQPSRYFLLYSIGAGICVAYSVDWLSSKATSYGILAWSLLLVECVMVGGLSLQIPATKVPSSDCVSSMEFAGGVLVWPWDGADDLLFEATLKSRLHQLQHEQPGATIGTGSWPLVGNVFPGKVLRDLGWRAAMDGNGQLDIQQLSDWGYRYAIVDKTAGRILSRRARDDVFGSENLVLSCPLQDIYKLPAASTSGIVPEHPRSEFQPVLEPQ